MHTRIAVLVVFCAARILAAPSEPARWPRFRGPGGAGVSDAQTIPVAWTAADHIWKTKLPGRGHSSPVVWDGKLFVTCADPQSAARRILCLDAETGRIRWRREFGSRPYKQHRDNSYASATPAVDEKGVYITWTTPEAVSLLALDHEGELKWRRDLGPFDSKYGSGASPITYHDLVVLPNDQAGPSCILAVDRETGVTRWKADRRSGPTPNARKWVK